MPAPPLPSKPSRTPRRLSPWWPFALLLLLGAVRWMLSESLPGSATTFASAAIGCGSAAALWLLIRRPARQPIRPSLRAAIGGALLLAGPMLALLRVTPAGAGVSSSALTMALALTPVVLAVAESSTRSGTGGLAGRLWPSLAAVAGLLLLLNQPSLSDLGADLILVLAPLLTGVGAVLFCAAHPSPWRVPAALLGAAAVFGLGGIVLLGRGASALTDMAGLAAGLDAAQAVLSLLTLERLSTVRWAAQFTFVPLIVLLEGILFIPASLPPRACIGLALLAIASIAQLLPATDDISLDLGASSTRPSRTDG